MSEQAKSNVVEFDEMKFPVIEYGVTEAQIAEVAERYKEPDASTDEGYERCKEGCKVLRGMRTAVETRRLDLKRPITEWVRVNVDVRGKELVRQIRLAEDPVRAEKERVDEIKQTEARKAAEAEQGRIDGIKANIKKIADTTLYWSRDDTASDYEQHTMWLIELQITKELFGEFVEEANTARDAALFKLVQWRDQALQCEQDDARRKAEQAALDQQREEQAATEQRQREAEEALEKKAREAEEMKAAEERAAEKKDEQEKESKATAEGERILHIRASIIATEDAGRDLDGKSPEFLSNSLKLLQGDPPREDEFQEFLTAARAAWQKTLYAIETEIKVAAEREEKERRDEEARLPDKDKLFRWCEAIADIPEPEVLNDKTQKLLKRYASDLSKFTDRLRSDIAKL